MKKPFFLVLVFFFSFSVSNLNLFAKTINITGESAVSKERSTQLLNWSDRTCQKKFWDELGVAVCFYCGYKIFECICSRNSICRVCFHRYEDCTCR